MCPRSGASVISTANATYSTPADLIFMSPIAALLLATPLVSATLGLYAHATRKRSLDHMRSLHKRSLSNSPSSPHATRSFSQLQRQGHLVRLLVARRPLRLGRGRQGPLPAQLRRLLAHVLRPRRLVRRVGEGRRVHQIARLHAQGVPDVVRPLHAQVRRHRHRLQLVGQGGPVRVQPGLHEPQLRRLVRRLQCAAPNDPKPKSAVISIPSSAPGWPHGTFAKR